MAFTKMLNKRKFRFESTTGKLWMVEIDWDTGVGNAIRLASNKVENGSPDEADGGDSRPRQVAGYDNDVAITVDGGSLAAWKLYHISRIMVAAVYNTTTALNTLLA